MASLPTSVQAFAATSRGREYVGMDTAENPSATNQWLTGNDYAELNLSWSYLDALQFSDLITFMEGTARTEKTTITFNNHTYTGLFIGDIRVNHVGTKINVTAKFAGER